MRRMLSIIFLSLLISTGVSAQRVVLNEVVPQDSISGPGPNRGAMKYLLGEIGVITGAPGGAGSAINYGPSFGYRVGAGIKPRISGLLSFGLEIMFQEDRFNLRQHIGKTLPNPSLHGNEVLRIQQLGGASFLRINFDPKRGNHIGQYIDLGFYGAWIAGGRHVYTERVHAASNELAERRKIKNKGLTYLEDFAYGPEVRLGVQKFSFFGRYRLSPLLDSRFADLPQFLFGIRLSK